jgi:membrane protein DedA with SNARE-associated domain
MSIPSLREWLDLLGRFYEHYGYLTVFLGTLGENTVFLGFLLPGNSLALFGALYAKLGRRIRLAGRVRLGRTRLKKHGGKVILVSHLVGHLRSFVALSAGMTRMNYWRFLGYELVAATLWNTVFCLLGYFLAGEIDRLQFLHRPRVSIDTFIPI